MKLKIILPLFLAIWMIVTFSSYFLSRNDKYSFEKEMDTTAPCRKAKLGKPYDVREIKHSIESVKNPERIFLLECLTEINSIESEEALKSLTSDSVNVEIRALATSYLSLKSLDRLNELANDKESSVRQNAANTIRLLSNKQSFE